MSRPSRNMDQRLLRAGLKLIPITGFSGLKVRQVAKLAKVNLGMFHYYFRTKDEFVSQTLQHFYEQFFKEFLTKAEQGNSPLEQLKNVLNAIGQYGRNHRKFLLVLLQDSLQGYLPTIRFAKKNIPRHLGIVMNLIHLCQKKGLIRKMPIPLTVSLLMGAIAVPNLVVALMEKTQAKHPFGMPLKYARNLMLSDSAIADRVEIALKGIAT